MKYVGLPISHLRTWLPWRQVNHLRTAFGHTKDVVLPILHSHTWLLWPQEKSIGSLYCPESLVPPDYFGVSLAFVVHSMNSTKDQRVSSLLTSKLAGMREREGFNAQQERERAHRDSKTAEQREEWLRKWQMRDRARRTAQTVQQSESCLLWVQKTPCQLRHLDKKCKRAHVYTNCVCAIVVLGILLAQACPTMHCICLVIIIIIFCHTSFRIFFTL